MTTYRLTKGIAALGVLGGLLVDPTTVHAGPPGAGNGKIAFESFRDGNQEIYAMNADGSNPTNLTKHTDGDLDPAWSPDGKKIAFPSTRAERGIYVMNADGSNATRISTMFGTAPAWSPDGKKIAFESTANYATEIVVINADGTNPKNLTNSPEPEFHPAWSPDGTKIAFQRENRIWVMNSDGTNSHQRGTVYALTPDWSPDGKMIAFTGEGDRDLDIGVMNADGSNPTIFTKPGDDWRPVWSPNGKEIAFEHRGDIDGIFNAEIFVMNADGSHPKNLTNAPGMDTEPSWQRAPALPVAAKPPVQPGSPPASAPPLWAAQPPRR